MNLGRAKAILIIAFIGLNLFLGYHLFWPDFGRLTSVAVTAEEMRITEAILKNNNYFLEASLDRAIQTSDFLTVSSTSDIQMQIMGRLIEKGALVQEFEGASIYITTGETTVFNSSGLTQILYDPGIFLAEDSINLELSELKSLVEQFINEKELMPEGIVFDYLEKTEAGSMILYYYQVLDNMPIFAGQLKVIIESDNIKAVEIYWLKLIERGPVREMEVISATEALTNLVKGLGPNSEPRMINRIDLGYFSGEYDAEKWEIPPVWRVVLDGQDCYYINAFTGNLEQDSIIPKQLP